MILTSLVPIVVGMSPMIEVKDAAACSAVPSAAVSEVASLSETSVNGCTIIEPLGGGFCLAMCGPILAIIDCEEGNFIVDMPADDT